MATESKTWFITGSSRGFGLALTRSVLEAGDRVVAAARRPADLASLVQEHGKNVLARIHGLTG